MGEEAAGDLGPGALGQLIDTAVITGIVIINALLDAALYSLEFLVAGKLLYLVEVRNDETRTAPVTTCVRSTFLGRAAGLSGPLFLGTL